MKSLKSLSEEMVVSPGMGAVEFPDVAQGTGDTFKADYKFGSGDIPGTQKKKKKKVDEDGSGDIMFSTIEPEETIVFTPTKITEPEKKKVDERKDDELDVYSVIDILEAFRKLSEFWISVNAVTPQSKRIMHILQLSESSITSYTDMQTNGAGAQEVQISYDVDKLSGKKLAPTLRGTDEWKQLKKLLDLPPLEKRTEPVNDMSVHLAQEMIYKHAFDLQAELNQ